MPKYRLTYITKRIKGKPFRGVSTVTRPNEDLAKAAIRNSEEKKYGRNIYSIDFISITLESDIVNDMMKMFGW